MKSLTLTFNSREAVECARTFLTNQNAPYRNSSVTQTVGLDVNTGEQYSNTPKETFTVTFSSQHWANRAETELRSYFNEPNRSTHSEPYVLTR